MELRHLRYFVAVAEAGSMTRAAERLGIQQPPLGQQIRKLEDELGVALFERRPRQITLSAAGIFFLDEARAVLRKAAEAAESLRRFDRGETGAITIGFTSSASLHQLAPKILRTFHDSYPLAEVSVRESETYELILALREGQIDIALLHISTDRYADLQSHILAQEAMMVAVPLGHRLAAHDRPLTLESLLGEDFIVYRRADGPGIFESIFKAVAAIGGRLRIAGEVSRLIATINLVAAGRGISIVPSSMRTLHREAVAYLPLAPEAMPLLPLYMAHRRCAGLAIVRNFIETTIGLARYG